MSVRRDFVQKDFGTLRGKDLAKHLAALGYRRVSNRYQIVARVDRPDWQEKNGHGQTLNADYYRRVLSQDWIEGVPPAAYKLIPNSHHDTTGYVAAGAGPCAAGEPQQS